MTSEPSIYYGIAFAIFCLALIIVVFTFDSRRQRRRRDELRRFAVQRGYQFERQRIAARELAPIAYLTASKPHASNVLRRPDVTLFDYTRVVPRVDADSDVTEVTCALFSLEISLPPFSFVPHSASPGPTPVLAMIRERAGMDLLPIADRPGFFLRTPEPHRVAPLFSEKQAQFFDDKIGWQIEAEGRWLLVRPGPISPPVRWFPVPFLPAKDYERFVAVAESIRDHFVSMGALQ